MAELYRREDVVNYSLAHVMSTIKQKIDWKLEFENVCGKEGELVYLTGMFSGARVLALGQGARKALLFIKLIESSGGTKIIVITGGTETMLGFDWSRHKRNVDRIFGAVGK
jgi:hypothetical protein